MKLNVGCYDDIRVGYINLDIEKYFDGIDVIHDLEKFPYPFKDNFFDEIVLRNVLEHIDLNKTELVLNELHRICKNKAVIKITVPYGSNWMRNIFHKRGFDFHTFVCLTRKPKIKKWQNKLQFGLRRMEGTPTNVGKYIPNPKIFNFGKKQHNVKIKLGLRDVISFFISSITRNIYAELIVIKK